jgi:hypothetical protein
MIAGLSGRFVIVRHTLPPGSGGYNHLSFSDFLLS